MIFSICMLQIAFQTRHWQFLYNFSIHRLSIQIVILKIVVHRIGMLSPSFIFQLKILGTCQFPIVGQHSYFCSIPPWVRRALMYGISYITRLRILHAHDPPSIRDKDFWRVIIVQSIPNQLFFNILNKYFESVFFFRSVCY